MSELILLLLLVALSYLLGELRCYKRVIHHQKSAIRAQDKALESLKLSESFLQTKTTHGWADSAGTGN